MEPPRNAVEAVTHPDPFAWYRRLREAQPIGFDETLGLWVASGAAAVAEAFRHAGLRVRPPAEPVPRALKGTAAGDVFALLVRMTDGEFQRGTSPRWCRRRTAGRSRRWPARPVRWRRTWGTAWTRTRC